VLARRTRLAIGQADGGSAAAPAVADLVGPLLGWDGDRWAREVAAHRAEVQRDRTALTEGPAATAAAGS
jgi:glycerol-3-phosphate dehydrogenase